MLLDMAMSQYSNGKLEVLRRQGGTLPIAGGYDSGGNLTQDPGAILDSRRPLPIGYWKGSALAVMLDAVAALVSGGRASHQIGREGAECAVSQVFLAINAAALGDEDSLDAAANAIVDDLHAAAPILEAEGVRYPGEGMQRTRRESLSAGVLVDEEQFAALRGM